MRSGVNVSVRAAEHSGRWAGGGAAPRGWRRRAFKSEARAPVRCSATPQGGSDQPSSSSSSSTSPALAAPSRRPPYDPYKAAGTRLQSMLAGIGDGEDVSWVLGPGVRLVGGCCRLLRGRGPCAPVALPALGPELWLHASQAGRANSTSQQACRCCARRRANVPLQPTASAGACDAWRRRLIARSSARPLPRCRRSSCTCPPRCRLIARAPASSAGDDAQLRCRRSHPDGHALMAIP